MGMGFIRASIRFPYFFGGSTPMPMYNASDIATAYTNMCSLILSTNRSNWRVSAILRERIMNFVHRLLRICNFHTIYVFQHPVSCV